MICKKFIIVLSAILAMSALFSACSDKPESSVSEDELSSIESSDGGTTSPLDFSFSQAAEQNNRIPASEINLIQFNEPADDAQMAIIVTTMGNIEVMLYPEEAPNAVENFITHAESGYYTGLVLNKVVKNFIIEGGDPDGMGGESSFINEGKAEPFKNEYSLKLWHFRGALAMSNNFGQDKNGSQFYIVQAPFIDDETKTSMLDIGYPEKVIEQYDKVGGTPGFDWKRTVFGMVTQDGMKVVDAIARVDVKDDGEPEQSIVIEEIRMTTYGEEKSKTDSSDS